MQAFDSTLKQSEITTHPPAWGAVFSMALCVVVLIASEFMPVSLLTPIAQDLGISQGQAGQAISISGFFAVLTSLLNTPLTGHLDRKPVLLGFSLLLLVSGVIVTLASNGWLFMTGRALLGIAIGMTAIMLLFMGQFAVFTYLRPFLEDDTGVSVTTLSLMLLLLGASGLLGTYLIGGQLQKRIYAWLIAIPLVMAVLAAALVGLGHSPLAVAAVLAAWGLIATPAPVAWGLWLSRALPDDAEAGGGLMVATIQMAITAGAGVGGALFDNLGWWSPFAFGGVVLAASAVLAGAARRNAGIDQQRHT